MRILFERCRDRKANVALLSREIVKFAARVTDPLDYGVDDKSDTESQDALDVAREEMAHTMELPKSRKTPEERLSDARNKKKGNAMEVFAEVFAAINFADERYGFHKFKGNTTDDYGVDAFGMNPVGENAVMQVKFRSNPKNTICYTDLSKTFTQGVRSGHITGRAAKSVYLFTNCAGANYIAENVLGNVLHVINGAHIDNVIEGNVVFWNAFIDILTQNEPTLEP
jgi:hypothetical protein